VKDKSFAQEACASVILSTNLRCTGMGLIMVKVNVLKNGIKVVTEELSYLRTVSFGVWIRVGSAKENKENNGISHMIEHMLFKGTKSKSAKEIADIIASIGDDVNAFTSKEQTCYYGTTITESLPILVELVADMLCNSLLSEEDLRKEKRVIYEEIDMYEDSADDMVHEILQQNVFKDHPLGYIISGYKKNVRSFKRRQLIDFMEKHYVAENIVISVAGNFSENELMNQLERCFGGIRGTNPKALNSLTLLKKKKEELLLAPYEEKYQQKQDEIPSYHTCFCHRHKDNEQLHINLAYPSIPLGSDESVVFAVVNSMLGGSNNSRLFQRIREELSLVYSIYTYGSSFEKAGLFHLDITVNPQQAFRVLRETKLVMDEFLATPITIEELDTHKAQVKTEFILGSESAKSRMNSNAKSVLVRGYVKTLDEVIEELNRLSAEDINRFANKVWGDSSASLCVIGAESGVSFRALKKEYQNLFLKSTNTKA